MAVYDSYVDSQIPYVGLIPSHWKTVQNKRVMHKKKQLCLSYQGQDIISLTMNGVVVRDLGAGGKMPATFDGYQFVYPGELLMCLFDIDVTPRCVGRVYNKGLTSPAYSSFVLKDNADLGYYYYYYLMLDHTKELLYYAKNLRHSLTEDQLGGINVPLPPIYEQRMIAEYLDKKIKHIDLVISEAKASVDEYKVWKTALVNDAVTHGINHSVHCKDSGVYWIGCMPKSWEVKRLKYMFAIKKDIAGEAGHTVLAITQQGVKPKNMADKGQFAADYSNYQLVRTGDFAMNHMDLLTGWVDISAHDGVTSPDYRVFYSLHPDEICADYYKHIFQNCYRCRIFYGLGHGVSGLGRWRLPADMFLNFLLPVPPIEEQREIADYLNTHCAQIDALIAEKEALIIDLEAYKKSLIFEVVTGKRRVME